MDEKPCKHYVCPREFTWEIDIDKKLQNNKTLVAKDTNKRHSLMDE
jgi:hypothetical protein